MSKVYEQLGKVVDGRIRKKWPTVPPIGPIKNYNSMSKGFENEEELLGDWVDPVEPMIEESDWDVEWAMSKVKEDEDGNLLDLDGNIITDIEHPLVPVSCFKIAVLQCLLHVPEFIHYLYREERCGNWRCYAEPLNKRKTHRCVFCALRDLALHYWTSTDRRFKQKKVYAVYYAMRLHFARNPNDPNNWAYQQLTPGLQHDSWEYFMNLVNMLHHVNAPHLIDEIAE